MSALGGELPVRLRRPKANSRRSFDGLVGLVADLQLWREPREKIHNRSSFYVRQFPTFQGGIGEVETL